MKINPVTLTVSRHHLHTACAVLEQRLVKLAPGTRNYTTTEGALFELTDAWAAATGERWRFDERIASDLDLSRK